MISGANSGIGNASMEYFLEKSFNVIALDINTTKLINKITPSLKVIQLDLSNSDAINSLFVQLDEEKICPDILINAAGIREIKPVLELSDDLFKKVIDVNLVAPFTLSRELAKRWYRSNNKGCIVNIASVSGVMAEPERAAYVASKHALIGLTKQLAMEFGKQNIRVNSISPGVIRTELTEDYFSNNRLMSLIKNNQSLDTWGLPDDIVSCIDYLISDQARFITGSNFVIDGGWTVGKNL
ncbi:3-oxoacyl-ACP reductase [Bacillus thuringiensis serovar roskildiensis]|uniref:3-oxoacyl-ACP reductase n=2 Tax=Bacillus thuringiensis TaxID=1428 RepID=A0A9Q5SL49_BACTU|nr:3-oxoacyl-ACP reductase [Bacillus thuringiensis serovar coreanensis]OTX51005.1 3-oxoacyl-ACP reductase [Bacillus thuringiensis serovar sooncheon]OTX56856.1 3-oxoacyl-ACP reductase [Bacillus thuringiensis serovar guiyangiensis]OTX71439.1 3-oxoacyl-ACP reductase [Bacillus thuringiensis serovar roskildiensis]OTY27183.1 3-oxoacyl-ACP reductase [Bacillus thuringiensis serovar rongseni]